MKNQDLGKILLPKCIAEFRIEEKILNRAKNAIASFDFLMATSCSENEMQQPIFPT